jgi:hypothetical protein
MAEVKTTFGSGGAGLTPGSSSTAVTLINELKNDLGEARALVNAVKAALNAIAAASPTVTKG